MSNGSNQSDQKIPGFSHIIGHGRQIESLVRAWQAEELPHAFLFVGQPGLGKRTVADAFARALICLRPSQGFLPCGVCRSCGHKTAGGHPDIVVYEPAGAQALEREAGAVGATSIDQVRDLREKAHFAPIYGEKKVFIIPRAETMSPAAANCLLKTFEEPPPFVVIVMIAPSQKRVFPTLVSRSRRLSFSPLPTGELADALVQRFGVPDQEAEALARTHCGRPGPAIMSLSDEGFSAKRRLFLDLACEMARADSASAFMVVDKIAAASALYASGRIDQAKGDEAADASVQTKTMRKRSERVARVLQADFLVEFVEFVSTWYRDMMVTRLDPDSGTIINRDFAASIHEMAARLGPRSLDRLLSAATTAKGLLAHNANSRLVLESLALRVAKARTSI